MPHRSEPLYARPLEKNRALLSHKTDYKVYGGHKMRKMMYDVAQKVVIIHLRHYVCSNVDSVKGSLMNNVI